MANIQQWKVGDVLSASKLNAMVDAINNLLAEQEVDVSNFITTEQLTIILEGYSDVGHTHTISEIVDLVLPTVPTKTSQLQNDSDFATNASVDEKIANVSTGGQIDLTSYAKKTDLPTKVSQLENDSNFISSIPEEYVTEQELNSKGLATETFVTNKIAEAQLGGGEGTAGTIISRLADMKWCVIGDSISDVGVGRTSKWYQEFISDRTGCTLVDWNGNGTGYIKSFNGQNGLIDRIDDIPDDSNVITIFLGTNDDAALGTLGSTDKSTFYGAVEYCIKTIKEKYPLIPLGVMTPLPSTYKPNASQAKAIKEVCAKYYVPVLDLNAICNVNLKSKLYLLNYMPDGLHPNDNLHRDISYRVQAWLENEVLVCKFTDNIIQRGLVVFPQSNLTYTAGSTLSLQVALSHIPNENQGVVLTCSNSAVTFSKSTLYFNKNKDTQTVNLTIPSSVSENITITGNTWGITTSLTINQGGSSGDETVAVQSISLDKSTHTMKVDETIQLNATINPSTATNKNVSWSTNNSNCTVSNGLVTAVTEGKCIVTVTTEDGSYAASCTITVEAKVIGGGDASEISIDDYIFKGDFSDNSNTAQIKDLSNYGNNVRLSGVTNWANGVMTITTPSGNAGFTATRMRESVETKTLSIELCFKLNEGANPGATIVFLSDGKFSGALTNNGADLGIVFKGIDTNGSDLWIGNAAAKDLDIYNYNHLVYTATTTEINVYVNGVLNNTMNISNSATLDHWLISSIQAYCYLFTGDVKCLNIYNKALTSEQVAGLYTNYNS